MNRKFKISDLDQETLEAKIDSELELIWSNPNSRVGLHSGKSRSKEHVRRDIRQGLAAEQYLIEKLGFTNDTRSFRDVYNEAGIPFEVKTASSRDKISNHLEKCKKLKGWYPETFPDHVCMFNVDIQTSDDYSYEFEGVYEWNGSSFEKA